MIIDCKTTTGPEPWTADLPPFRWSEKGIAPILVCRICGGSAVVLRDGDAARVAFCNQHRQCLIKWKAAKS
jgi:hypothetical protein